MSTLESYRVYTEDTVAAVFPPRAVSVTSPPPTRWGTATFDVLRPSLCICTGVTVAPDAFELSRATPFGSAIRRVRPGRIVVNVARLKAIYEVSAPAAKKKRDLGNSGRIRTDFVVDQSGYQVDAEAVRYA